MKIKVCFPGRERRRPCGLMGALLRGGQMGRVMSAVGGRRGTGPAHEARARGPRTGPEQMLLFKRGF